MAKPLAETNRFSKKKKAELEVSFTFLTNLPRPLDTLHPPTYTFFPYNYSFYVILYLTYTTVPGFAWYFTWLTIPIYNLTIGNIPNQNLLIDIPPIVGSRSRTEGLGFTVANWSGILRAWLYFAGYPSRYYSSSYFGHSRSDGFLHMILF